MYTIREFNHSDADFEALLAIGNAAWPDEPNTLENLKFSEENRNMDFLRQRFLVEVVGNDGQSKVVAECGAWESSGSHIPGKYGVGLEVHPDYLGEGIEAQLYDHLIRFLNQRELKPIILDTFMREDKIERVKLYTDRGFEVVLRENESALVVTDFDFSRFEGAVDKVAANDIEISTLVELKKRFPDWIQRSYDLSNTINNDVPSPDQPTPPPVEQFVKMFDRPSHLANAQFIALDGDQWVGLSTLNKDLGNLKRLWVGITGVLRSHRRKGIATALKLKTIQYAIDNGASFLQTANEENNPMYDLNMMLGFEPMPAWLELRKMVDGG